MYIGIDIGGTTVKYALVDEKGNLSNRFSIRTNHNKERFIEDLVKIVSDFKTDHSDIRGIGISCPGIIRNNGFLLTAGSIKSLYGFQLKKEIQTITNLPVVIENDANAAAIAEKWIGNAQNNKNYICVVLGTGVGGGIIINDQLYRGANGMAGEFGWMLIDRLPKEGNIETASLNQKAAVVGGLCKHFNILKMKENRNFKAIDDAKVIFEQEGKDPIATLVVKDFFQSLSVGLLNLISCFDPEVVLIGGGVSENETFFNRLVHSLDELTNQHESTAYLKGKIFPPLKQVKLKNDAGIIGAAYLVHQLNKD